MEVMSISLGKNAALIRERLKILSTRKQEAISALVTKAIEEMIATEFENRCLRCGAFLEECHPLGPWCPNEDCSSINGKE